MSDAIITIQDGGIGLVSPGSDRMHAKVGPCEKGTVNTVYTFGDQQTILSTLGDGPLAESAALALLTSKRPVICVRTPSSTAGAAGSVTPTRVGTSTGTVTVAGGALDQYDVIILVAATGTLGTGQFSYSLDGGRNYVGPIYIPSGPATYAIPRTGLTLTFVAGGGPTFFEVGDQHAFAATAPTSTGAELAAGIQALIDSTKQFELIHVCARSTSVANLNTLFSTVDAKMTLCEAGARYAWALLECPSDTDANIIAGVTNRSLRVGVAADFGWYQSAHTKRQVYRSAAWAAAARSSQVSAAEDLGNVARGPAQFVRDLNRDERKTPGLNSAGFIVFTTRIGLDGVWLERGRILTAPGSDFQFTQYREVIDIATAVARPACLRFLNETFRTNSDGTIFEADARQVERYIAGKEKEVLLAPESDTSKALAVAITVAVDRTINLLTLQKVLVRIRVQPFGYAGTVEATIGFAAANTQAVG